MLFFLDIIIPANIFLKNTDPCIIFLVYIMSRKAEKGKNGKSYGFLITIKSILFKNWFWDFDKYSRLRYY